jgi:predicted amidohydrolase
MHVSLVQLDIAWEDPPRNYARAHELLAHARLKRESLVVLPELFACGFSMNVDRVGEDEPRATENFLRDVAREFGVFVVGGVAARTAGRVRNEAVVVNPPGDMIARYAKLHPFTLAGEKDAYAAGEDVVLFDWAEFKVAPFVCYDLRFPEIFRRAVRRGANLFTVIANWPSARVNHWVTLLQARAIENQAYVVGANRCGRDPKLEYPGRSLVIDPLGNIIADAGDHETVLAAEVDFQQVARLRAKLPFLNDLRAEFLG